MTDQELFLARTEALNRCVAELDELRAALAEMTTVATDANAAYLQMLEKRDRAEADVTFYKARAERVEELRDVENRLLSARIMELQTTLARVREALETYAYWDEDRQRELLPAKYIHEALKNPGN